MSAAPNTRVIVMLPFPRPDNAPVDPVKIVWTAEKANILWEVIAKARGSDSGGADWKGLAAHLDVPLPYLLYRAQLRYEEDLKGLQEIRGNLSPIVLQTTSKQDDTYSQSNPVRRPHQPSQLLYTSPAIAEEKQSTDDSQRLTALGVRERLASLTNRSVRRQSSSTITIQGHTKVISRLPPTSPSTSGSDSEEEEETREADIERKLEEQEILDRKLRDLQKRMNDIGLVSSPRVKNTEAKKIGREDRQIRGRLSNSQQQRPRDHQALDDELSSRSQSISSTTSPRGSIPSIPSPSRDVASISPPRKQMVTKEAPVPPTLPLRTPLGKGRARSGHLSSRFGRGMSDEGSAQGSSASSFSDISDASLSASALESALLSNVRGQGSRYSAASVFARNRFSGRSGL